MENKLKIAVVGMIDNSIRRALENKKSLDDIICELNERANSNFRVIENEGESIASLYSIIDSEDYDKPQKLRYSYYVIQYCYNRINDIDWVIKNKYKFERENDFDLVSLSKLRGKLKSKNESI